MSIMMFASIVYQGITKKLEKKFCNICLVKGKVKKIDKLELCSNCLKKVKELEAQGEPHKIGKENIAGGIKDEL